jgi:hypothetical protein
MSAKELETDLKATQRNVVKRCGVERPLASNGCESTLAAKQCAAEGGLPRPSRT